MVMAGTLAVGILTFLYFYFHDMPELISYWFAVLLALAGLRLAIYLKFKNNEESLSPQTWMFLSIIMTGLAGLLFGSLEITHVLALGMPVEADIVVALIIAGMCAAGASVNSISLMAVLAFLVPALSPLILSHFLLESDTAHWTVGMAVVAYLVLLTISARQQSVFLHEMLHLRHTTASLLDDMILKDQRLIEAQQIAKIGYFHSDITNNSNYISDQAYHNFGLEPGEPDFTFQKFIEMIHPEDRERMVGEMNKNMGDRKKNGVYEFRVVHPDGSIHYQRTVVEIAYGDSGAPTMMRGSSQDITEMSRVNAALRTQAMIMEHIAEGVQMTRVSDSVIVHTNPKFEAMFGYGPGELIGKHVSVLNFPGPKKSPEEMANEIDEATKSNGEWNGEIHNIKKDGVGFWTSATVTRYQDAVHGDVMLTVQKDISEKRLIESKLKTQAAIIENVAEGVMMVSANKGLIVHSNPNFDKMLGYETGELVGRHVSIINHPIPGKTPQQIAAKIIGALNEKGDWHGEVLNVKKDGTPIWTFSSVTRYMDAEHGDVLLTLKRDISETKSLHDQVEESEEWHKALFSNAPDAILLADPETGIMLDVNEAGMWLLDKKREDIIGAHQSTIHPPRILDEIREVFSRHAKGETGKPVETLVLRGDGAETPVEISAHTLMRGGKKVVHGIFRDITERKKAADRLKKAKEQAEEATRTKDKFVSLVAHDLKSPLGAISGFLDHILQGSGDGLSPDNKEILSRVVSISQVMVRTIDELLDISRLRSGDVQPRQVFFDARDMVAMVFGQASLAAEQKEVSLVNETPEKLRLFADTSLYYEALANLVTNAIKFSHKGDTVRIYPNLSGATLVVEDTGAGMSQTQIDNLFKQGVKTSTPGTAGEKGTGLGLPYALDILRAHGGDLRVDSEPGKGSRFYVQLPEVKPMVLVADDERGIRALIRANLARRDFLVEEAEDGAQALEILKKASPHIMLLDISMPGMDGFAVIQTIREEMKNSSLPIIVTTADGAINVKEKALKMGANDFLTKPLDMEDMGIRIDKLIVRHEFGWR
ncbi:MAG: PAS domain S-box protein [Nitrospinota bacterium]|nr:PAS domain S-box protein [Nitrospinota bacterium]